MTEKKAKTDAPVARLRAQLADQQASLLVAEEAYAAAQRDLGDPASELEWEDKCRVLRKRIERTEAELADAEQAATLQAAKDRVAEIERQHIQLTTALEQHEVELNLAAGAYAKAARLINDTWREWDSNQNELRALHDRFAIDVPSLPRVSAPDHRDAVVKAARAVDGVNFANGAPVIPATELDDTGLNRIRRTYAEVSGTLTYELIKRAGPKPWPELTPRQQRIVKDAAEAAVEQSEMLASEAIKELGHGGRDPRFGV